MIKFISGDIFLGGYTALGQGCNTLGAMGAGIAVEFRKRFPEMYKQYRDKCNQGLFQPGTVFPYTDGTCWVFNLMTQGSKKFDPPILTGTGYASVGIAPATLEAIEESVILMLTMAHGFGLKEVAIPKIGAGLGGLDWNDVKDLLVRVAKDHPVNLLVFEEFVPNQTPREI